MTAEKPSNEPPFPKWNLWPLSIVEAPDRIAMNVTCIRAGVKDIPSGALIAKALYIEACMTGNPHFPAPVPSITAIAAKRAELEHWTAQAEGRGFAAVATRWAVHAELERLLVQLSKHVMAQAQGDISMQLSSGFELRRPPLRITDLAPPMAVDAKRTDHEGGIRLSWSKVHGARTYQVFMNTTEDEDRWQLVTQTTRIRTELKGLEPGVFHNFRIRAIFAAGDGPFSQVSGCRVA